MVELILGILAIGFALYIFKLADGADPYEDMFLIDTCIVTGTLLIVISIIPIISGLAKIIYWLIY